MKPIVLIGSPGSGKGTQGRKLADYFQIPHISTGEILRDHVASGTLIGYCVKEQIDKGLLVPDGLMEDIITSRLKKEDCADGYLLDGYPRTMQQAQWYYARYGHPSVVLLEVPEGEVLRRVMARKEGRPDDGDAHIFIDRMEEYAKFTAPLIGYYEREAKLFRVDGTIGIDNCFNKIRDFLEAGEEIAYG